MRIDGKYWHVWRARGPLYQRQIEANRAGCVAAFEQHLNSTTDKDVNYAMAIVAKNASEKSKAWGRDYIDRVVKEFGNKKGGLSIGPPRGEYNIKFYRCPAILLEPGFVSNYLFANVAQGGEGIDALARVLVDSVCEMFPGGGLISCSVGHLYRGTPDSGAPVNDEDDEIDPAFNTEGEINDIVVTSIEEMLLLREPDQTLVSTVPPAA